jgi:hypothetical protein
MISGYEPGTEVKWNSIGETLTIGTVAKVYRASTDVELDGEVVHVDVREDSPSYLINRADGGQIILSHHDVMLKEVNEHT